MLPLLVCRPHLQLREFTLFFKGKRSVFVCGKGWGWPPFTLLLAALCCLPFHTLCKLPLINLPHPGRACVTDTGAFISQMERQQCWGNVTGPRSHSESLEWTQNRNTAACRQTLLLLRWAPKPTKPPHVLSPSMPNRTASKISFVSLTPPSGDPGSRLALSTFWDSCNLDSGIILTQEQLILGTLVLWKSCLNLASLTATKGLYRFLCYLYLHAFRGYAFISADKLILGDTYCR